MKISTVESFTGGLMAAKLTSIPGASKFFAGSIVTYQNEIKEKLGINTSKGVVNKEVVREMSLKGNEFFKSDICISFTGNAGPSTLDDLPVGKCFVAINDDVFELNLSGTREEIRKKAVDFAYSEIEKLIF